MGWTVPYDMPHRKDLIQERTEAKDWTIKDGTRIQSVALKHCFIGGRTSGTLYIVWDRTRTSPDGTVEASRFIEVDLLRYYPKGRGMGDWGYKEMDCCMGPYAVCPPSYQDLCPPHDAEHCRAFHERSREYWRVRGEQARKRRGLKVGDRAALVAGCKVSAVVIESLRPLIGRGVEDGRCYRVRQAVLA